MEHNTAKKMGEKHLPVQSCGELAGIYRSVKLATYRMVKICYFCLRGENKNLQKFHIFAKKNPNKTEKSIGNKNKKLSKEVSL